jgi:hypothetical protein
MARKGPVEVSGNSYGFLRLPRAVIPVIAFLLALHSTPALALDPCAYIDQGEAAAILGEAVKEGRAGTVSGFAGGLSCAYFTAAPLAQRGGTGSIQLVIHEKSTMTDSVYNDPREFFEKLRETSGKSRPGTIVPVDGVGETAYWQSAGYRLHFLADETYFILSVKDLVKISSQKGREDLEQQLSAHRLQKSRNAALLYVLPKSAAGSGT